MKSFSNKVAAITGAGSGIGQQLAVLLAKAGCQIALSDINEQGLQDTAALLAPYGVKVTSCKLDVANKDAVYAWADQVVADHGKVNMIFNNAGVALSCTVASGSIEDYEWLMGINFWGVVYGTKAFLPYLKQSGDGHIVNTSSLFGLTAQPFQSAYNASKFAVRGFTESLRQELDMSNCGVSVTCVHPGGIATNIGKNARLTGDRLMGNAEKTKAKFDKFLRKPAVEAAQEILNAVQANKRRLLIGYDAKALDLLQRVLPSGYQNFFVQSVKRMTKT